MPVDNHALYELELLRHIEQDKKVTNRLVAGKLGVSVRLAHDILKRMAAKGLIHVKVVHSRRWDYFLTPKGLMEKARLTLEFFEFSMHFYHEARKRSAQVCRDISASGTTDIGIIGCGDLAEITYLGIQEWKLNLAGVFDDSGIDNAFMSVPVEPLVNLVNSDLRAIIVCVYDKEKPMGQKYLPPNITGHGAFHWVF